MSDDRMARLEQRLAIAERDAELMREQLRTMGDRRQPRSQVRRNGILGLLSASFLLFVVTQPISTEAQGAAAQGLTVKAPFQVVDASNKVILRVESLQGSPSVLIGDPKAGGAWLGAGASGAGFALVRKANGSNGTVIGQWSSSSMGGSGSPMGVRVFGADGEAIEAALLAGPKGGSLKVMTAAGTPVAALLAGDTGGGVVLTGPSGGASAVSLSVSSTGGNVRVFPQAGGSVHAELTASDSGGGELNVYNRAGENVAWMQASDQNEGLFVLGHGSKVYVKAAVLPSGVGMVAAGPQIGATDAGGIPSFIKGHAGGK